MKNRFQFPVFGFPNVARQVFGKRETASMRLENNG
jgi:hypothetical protein